MHALTEGCRRRRSTVKWIGEWSRFGSAAMMFAVAAVALLVSWPCRRARSRARPSSTAPAGNTVGTVAR